jgi:hypothetical protein
MVPQNGWLYLISIGFDMAYLRMHILPKERYNGGGLAIEEPAGCGTCSPMMYNGSYMLEQPFMGTIPKIEDILERGTAKFAPASRNNCPTTTLLDSIEKNGTHLLRIINNDASKPNVNRRRTSLQESFKVWRR